MRQNKKTDQKKSTKKQSNFIVNSMYYFTDFSSSTGIHGFKYLGDWKRPLMEKLWWLIFFTVSLYFCINLIVKAWIKWQNYPVLVSFARTSTPVWQIPFPAITVCTETKARKSIANFTKLYHLNKRNNISEEELEDLNKFSLICDYHLFPKGMNFTNATTLHYLKEIAPTFDDIFQSCYWLGDETNCKSLFTPTITDEGYCYTFNMLNRNQLLTKEFYLYDASLMRGPAVDSWSPDDGYLPTSGLKTYPKRAVSSGASAGLFLILKNFQQDLEYICKGPVQGFKVIFRSPVDSPRISARFFRAPLNQEVIFAIKPDMMTTSDGLKDYDPQKRQCFFPYERKLFYFNHYTQDNCNFECLTNFTLDRCDCVAFWMPRNRTTKVCGSGRSECMIDARQELLTSNVESELTNLGTVDYQPTTQCNCLPSCTSLSYEAENSRAEFLWKQYFDSLEVNLTDQPGILMTRIGIYFKDMQFITIERNELYGLTDFLGACGGLFGLFTGFSFLTSIEILYFFTLRLICNIHKYGTRFWSGSKELMRRSKRGNYEDLSSIETSDCKEN